MITKEIRLFVNLFHNYEKGWTILTHDVSPISMNSISTMQMDTFVIHFYRYAKIFFLKGTFFTISFHDNFEKIKRRVEVKHKTVKIATE